MSWNDCISSIAKALSRDETNPLTQEEKEALEQRVGPILKRIQKAERNGRDPNAALEEILNEHADDVKRERMIQLRTAVNGVLQRQKLYNDYQNHWKDNPAGYVEALHVGVNTARQGAKDSLAAAVASQKAARISAWGHELDKEGLLELSKSGIHDQEIKRIEYAEQNGQDTSQFNPSAKKIYDINKKHMDLLVDDRNAAGGWTAKRKGYSGARTWDMYKVAKAGGDFRSKPSADAFRRWMYDNVDLDKTFPDMTPGDRDKWINKQFNEFSTGKHDGYDEADIARGSLANLGRRYDKSRTIVLKSPEAEYDQLRRFGAGNGTIHDTVSSQLNRGARDLAISSRIGISGANNVDKVFGRIRSELLGGNSDQLRAFDKAVAKAKSEWYPSISGQGAFHGNYHLAQISTGIMNMQRAAMLGSTAINGMPDLNAAASILNFYGSRSGQEFLANTAQMAASQVEHMATGFGEDKRLVAAEGRAGLEGLYEPLIHADSPSGFMAKMAGLTTKLGLAERHWNALRYSAVKMLGTRVAQYAGKAYDEIPPGLRDGLMKFGIDANGWDTIRASEPSTIGEGTYLMPANVADKNLADKLGNFFHEVAASSSLSYGIASGGQVPRAMQGTIGGEIMRQTFLFRGFLNTFLKQHAARELYGYTADRMSLAEALSKAATLSGPAGKSAAAGTAGLVAGAMTWKAIANALASASRGQQPEVPQSPEAAAAYAGQLFLSSGALGFYGSVMDQQIGQHTSANDMIASALGPTAETAHNYITPFLDLYHGKGDKAAQDAWKAFYGSLPMQNLWYTRWATDYLIKAQVAEALNPGYMDRIDTNARNNGAPYFLDHRQQ